jgi:hypothetical protein
MLQIQKIVTGKDNEVRESWFKMASEALTRTKQASGLTNIVKLQSRLDVRANFFCESS